MTPMQQQWAAAKARAKDAILLFRMGDFYELFAEDAILAAPILELALTSRDKEKDIPMAGFPHQAAPAYIAKLIAQGFKVAICDQLEDPQLSKGIIKRDITRIVTPGTVLEDDSLISSSNNYLVAITLRDKCFTLCALDLSTGDFITTETVQAQNMVDEISKLNPAEILFGGNAWPRDLLQKLDQVANQTRSCRFEFFSDHLDATQLIKDYIRETQKESASFLVEPRYYSVDSELILDSVSREHLDIKGLFQLCNKTCTAMGARLLNRWLHAPSTCLKTIQDRQEQVQSFLEQAQTRKSIRTLLKEVYDLERLSVKILTNHIQPRELGSICNSLEKLPELQELCSHVPDTLRDIYEILSAALVDQPPMLLKEGGIFKTGYDALLDELVDLASGGRHQIAAIEQRERDLTGIPTLKIKYTRVFGYYIEITHTHLTKVPGHYRRKQTVSSGERYVTEELARLEEMVTTADIRRQAKESELFETLKSKLRLQTKRLSQTASSLAQLDVFVTLAEIAEERRYTRPILLDKTLNQLEIEQGRHPILEALGEKQGQVFVPNSLVLNSYNRQLLLITGPNMAGKSTLMRQIALIQLLAQTGSFVPAKSATLSICDRIFTRVGASDDSRHGRSTFMVEMTETAHILHHATPYSLVLLDEIGRGTSTFDGLSIAWAVAEHLHNHVRARTLFATHYHELTQLSDTLSHMHNLQVAILEQAGEIKFLYTLQEGAAGRSYGIQVAQLAGLPSSVLNRASEILSLLEAEKPVPKITRPPKEQIALL